jgi:hypothetical protein
VPAKRRLKRCSECGETSRSVELLYCPDCDLYACTSCARHLPPDYDTPRCPSCWLRLRPVEGK